MTGAASGLGRATAHRFAAEGALVASLDHFEDLAPGDTIATPARTITEADVVQFAQLTADGNPIQPLFIGDTIHAVVTITDARLTSDGKRGIVERAFAVLNSATSSCRKAAAR